jgi:hypothetical protein
MKKSKLNSEKIWKIQKKCKLNSEKIGKMWKKGKLNSEKIWKIWKKPKLNSYLSIYIFMRIIDFIKFLLVIFLS